MVVEQDGRRVTSTVSHSVEEKGKEELWLHLEEEKGREKTLMKNFYLSLFSASKEKLNV